MTTHHTGCRGSQKGAPFLKRRTVSDTRNGNEKWIGPTVRNILTNEKYKGDALLQKKYTSDYLTKKVLVNHGEVPQYYVSECHEAIIEPQIFDLVQAEVLRRNGMSGRHSTPISFLQKSSAPTAVLGSAPWSIIPIHLNGESSGGAAISTIRHMRNAIRPHWISRSSRKPLWTV